MEQEKSSSPVLYRVGTLTYTRLQLIAVCAWMLYGIFCFCLMEALVPSLLPLSLKRFDASNTMIGILVGSIPGILNFIVNPIVSTRSDRTRTRIGRRMPYLLFATPFVTLFLLLIGWAPDLGHQLVALLPGQLQVATVVLILLGLFTVCFQFFNMFVASIFYYVAPDVIPEKVLGRFMSLWTVTGAATSFCFSRYLFPLAKDHMPWVYTGVAIAYFLSFMVLCLKVREGEYPPPEPEKKVSLAGKVEMFLRECYSIGFYRLFFIVAAMNAVSVCCRSLFQVFFAEQNLGLELGIYGKILSYGSIVTLVLAFPIGLLVDKIHPIRVYLGGMALVVLVNLFGFFMVQEETSFLIFALLLAMMYTLQNTSTLPLYAALFPKSRYGQFSSAMALLTSVALIAFNFLAGVFIDWIGDYRYIYLWDFAFTGIAFVLMLFVYRDWKKRGGTAGFRPPDEKEIISGSASAPAVSAES